MARSYGKIYPQLWATGSDFTHISSSAQRLYLFLISQPDLSRAGVLTLAKRRWARAVQDETVEDIDNALRELAREQFVIVDEDCEEVLIRSFIRWDEGWKSPYIMISLKQTASQVMSETLRAVIREELKRLDLSDLPTQVNQRTGRSTKDFVEMVLEQTVALLADDETDNSVLDWGGLSDDGELLFENRETCSQKGSGKGLKKGFNKGSQKEFLTVTATETRTETRTETETETETSLSESAPKLHKKSAEATKPENLNSERNYKPTTKAIPLPENWRPAYQQQLTAIDGGLTPSEYASEYEKFRLWCEEKNTTSRNFDKRFSRWIINAIEHKPQKTEANSQTSKTKRNEEKNAALVARIHAQSEAMRAAGVPTKPAIREEDIR